MTLWEWIVIILMILGSFVNAIILAVFLKVLNVNLARNILIMEFMSLLRPKVKIVAFLLMMQLDIKEDLSRIASTSDQSLLREYQEISGHEKITLYEIKLLKEKANYMLKKSKTEELISYGEVKNILKNEGILNFFSAIKRSVNRYGSFEQQERYIDSSEVDTVWQLLTNKTTESFNVKKERYIKEGFKNLTQKHASIFLDKVLFSV